MTHDITVLHKICLSMCGTKEMISCRDVNKDRLQNSRHLAFITKAKDISFMVDHGQGQGHRTSRTFQGLLYTQCFIIHYIILCKIYQYKYTVQIYKPYNHLFKTYLTLWHWCHKVFKQHVLQIT